ncbi:MAG: YggS family pyridoxal phosphate-dependent enzyme [Treponema sp.]|nr:YggS family pyridoxal phosphate-dependent enzyme [Treponema sp.]
MSIASNIEKIEERIQKACIVSGRKRGEITLLGVSKFQELPAIDEAWKAGIRLFGESRVKEGVEKFSSFRENHRIEGVHLIGSLQRNKAKSAAEFFDCIQSVDRRELLVDLEKHSGHRAAPLDILLELHTGEDSKSGFPDTDSLCAAAELALNCGNLRLKGLMTMAPLTADTGAIRASFRRLVQARDALESRFSAGGQCSLSCLSMGMSGDFEIAVEEGSTMLRIGSALFSGE